MHRYGGIVIHQSRDEHGTIEVVEDGAYRSLHFGSEPKQSSMELHNPIRLALTYTRAMTAALLFNDAPRSVLLIGLGGGSLAKFLLHHALEMRTGIGLWGLASWALDFILERLRKEPAAKRQA